MCKYLTWSRGCQHEHPLLNRPEVKILTLKIYLTITLAKFVNSHGVIKRFPLLRFVSRHWGLVVHICIHDDVIKWKHFPRYWPFVPGIHWSPVNSPHKGQWRGALVFSLICAWTNGLINNRNAGDLRRHRAHYDVTLMIEFVHPWFKEYNVVVHCSPPTRYLNHSDDFFPIG